MNLIDLCRELIAIDSTILAGTQEISRFIQSLGEKLELFVEIQEEFVEGRSDYNVMVSPLDLNQIKNSSSEIILLLNHLDSSNPGPLALWTKHRGNPFNLLIENQKLYGLGIAESKADIAAKLLALTNFKHAHFKKIPVFLGVFGHQTGMKGMQRWLKKNTFKIAHAILGQPTDLKPIFAVNGYARVDIYLPYSKDESEIRRQNLLKDVTTTSTRLFKGVPKSGVDFDSSMDLLKQVFQYFDQLPSNASLMDFDGGIQFNVQPSQILTEVDVTSNLKFPMIKKITELYKKFCDLHIKMKQNSHFHFRPSHLTFNIGMIRSNAEEVVLSGIVRIPPHIETNEILFWEQEAKSICSSLEAQIQLTDFKPPYKLAQSSQLSNRFKQSLDKLELPSEPSSLYLSNEACLLGRKNIECVVFGPGNSSNNLHSPDEYVLIEATNQAYHFYTHWISKENA